MAIRLYFQIVETTQAILGVCGWAIEVSPWVLYLVPVCSLVLFNCSAYWPSNTFATFPLQDPTMFYYRGSMASKLMLCFSPSVSWVLGTRFLKILAFHYFFMTVCWKVANCVYLGLFLGYFCCSTQLCDMPVPYSLATETWHCNLKSELW